MILAAPVYKDSISPLFDSAGSLLTLRWENGREIARNISKIGHLSPTEKVILIKELNPDIFICSAISGFWYNYLVVNKVKVFPHITGGIEKVIHNAFINKFPKNNIPGPIPESVPVPCKKRRTRGLGGILLLFII
ncbi:MAG: hypothetical protein ABIA63_03805 [bacterium]